MEQAPLEGRCLTRAVCDVLTPHAHKPHPASNSLIDVQQNSRLQQHLNIGLPGLAVFAPQQLLPPDGGICDAGTAQATETSTCSMSCCNSV